MKPTYSIVIPTFNKCSELLDPCVNSIIEWTDLSNVEIIVVANGCTDNTKEFIEKKSKDYPSIKLLWFDDAIGYTKATNEGIKLSQGDYIVLLNNDTKILDWKKNLWIDLLREPFLKYTDCGMTGPFMNYDPNCGRHFLIFFCVMIKREAIDKVGLLDECFSPGYGEDSDMCCRFEDAGFRVIQVPEDSVLISENGMAIGYFPLYHKGAGTFGIDPEKEKLIQRNSNILKNRYMKTNLNIDQALMCDGWFSESEIKWVAKTVSELKSDGKIICGEAGSWHGRSALATSLNMPPNSVFYAIDTFLGSKDERNSSHVSAKLLNGDHAFITFLQNTFDLVQNGTIIPLRLDSINAANFLKEKGIKFNFFFIDSAHDYDSVKREISAYLPLMKKNSILCGHDYVRGWDGVIKAVNESFPTVSIAPGTSIWYTTV